SPPPAVREAGGAGGRPAGPARPPRVEMIGAVRGDGEALTLAVSAAPIQTEHGTLIVESYRDITADVRIQRKYTALLGKERRAKAELEAEVRARTSELRAAGAELARTHAQLIHQEKMSSLGRLVAGIAHELNNPINFVYGNVDFLGRYMEDLLALVALYDQGAAALPTELRTQIEERKEHIELHYL